MRVLERAVGSSLLQQMAQRAAVAHAVLLPERGGKRCAEVDKERPSKRRGKSPGMLALFSSG